MRGHGPARCAEIGDGGRQLASPHAVYNLGLADLAKPITLADAPMTAWRYLVEEAGAAVASAEVGVDAKETTRLPLDGDTAKALAYFKTNAHRMRYAYFREHGMFIGSGTVEAGCKAVVGQRLKLSGMRWNIPGATGILTLRCEQASNRFEHIWTRPTPGTAGRGSTAVPGIMRLCLTTDEWLSGMGLRSLPAG